MCVNVDVGRFLYGDCLSPVRVHTNGQSRLVRDRPLIAALYFGSEVKKIKRFSMLLLEDNQLQGVYSDGASRHHTVPRRC